MSQVLEQMKKRRSIRKFKPDMVPQEILDQIIEAGLYAASGKGQQNTIIIQVTDRKLRDEIAKRNCEIGGWYGEKSDRGCGSADLGREQVFDLPASSSQGTGTAVGVCGR